MSKRKATFKSRENMSKAVDRPFFLFFFPHRDSIALDIDNDNKAAHAR